MAQLETATWQYLRWPVAFFCDEWGGFLFLTFFLHSKGNCDKWCLITKFDYHVRGITTLRQAVGNDMKNYSLHLIFTFYLNRVTLVLKITDSLSLYFIKNSFSISLCWPTDWQLKLSLKLLDRGRKIQNDVHVNTYYCKPDLISWRFNTRFLPPTDQKCADCRTYWLFYYRPPGEFLYSGRGR